MQPKRAAIGSWILVAMLSAGAVAQTREQGPWWPHPIWGGEDQAGASNWITPAKVLEAVELVTIGKVYELGHTYESGMPLYDPGRKRISVKFFVVAIIFILFDVEAAFLFPWAVVFRELGKLAFVEMGVFLGLLALGYVYLWKKGALEWD